MEIHLYNYPSKFSKNKPRVLIYYPNTYYIGMSNLGFQTIYHKLKLISEIYVERGFYPSIKSYESGTSIKEFDIIIFSVSFEIDFLNIIEILIKSEIELYSDNRKSPLLCAGGIAITLNPFIMKKIFDYQFIGEGEELITEFIKFYLSDKYIPLLEGIFSKKREILKRRIYNGDYVAHSVILSDYTEFSNTMLIEIARGCPFSCKFCAVSFNYSPFRIRDKSKIFDIIDNFDIKFEKVGLVSSNVCSHPDFIEICEYLLMKNKKFSISSLRLDTLTDEIVKILKKGKNSTFTVAIEAGSESLRKKINKRLTNEQIFKAIDIFIKNKVLNLKFYFMIGLPNESFEDVIEIVKIIKKIKEMYLKNRKYLKHFGKFTISVNPFIPKRNTPFFNYEIEKLEILQKKMLFLKKELKRIPNITLIFENLYSSYVQYILSKKGENFLPLIIEKVKNKISHKKFIDKLKEI